MKQQWPEAPTWPSLDEIFAGQEDRLRLELQQLIAQRYLEHAPEYASAEFKDGIPINLCWYKDSLQDVEEELVDAVFNALIYAMKYPASNAGSLIQSLVMTWDILQRERKRTNGAS